MTTRRRALVRRFLPWLIVFVAGVALGYVVRDRQQHDRLENVVEQTRREMERASLEAIDRARRAGGDLSAGAAAAAESTRAAFQELFGK